MFDSRVNIVDVLAFYRAMLEVYILDVNQLFNMELPSQRLPIIGKYILSI